jgi:hypothetical protein
LCPLRAAYDEVIAHVDHVGMVIGKAGACIRAIRESSRTQIDMENLPDSSDHKAFQITGPTYENVADAKRQIQEIAGVALVHPAVC